ncbi:MAG: YceI family protein [Acidobacteriia bacterium]|nr:YceI family protein [Terriglobia bacterium]
MRVRRILLSLLVAALALATPAVRAADTFSIDPAHSNVGFSIRHLISRVTGRFADFSGTILLDGADPTKSTVAFTIKAASIDTAEPKRDAHLRSPDFFEVAKFPELTFQSTRISKTTGSTYQVTGKFTLHGVSKEITIPVEFLGTAKDPWGNDRAGFSTSFTLDRKDYGIVWNKVLDAGGTFVGDEVSATINVEAVKEKPQASPAAK